MYFLKSYHKNHLEKKKCDILVVSSCGGHLKQIVDLEDAYKTKSVFFAINDVYTMSKDYERYSFRIVHAERNLLQILHIFEAFIIFFYLKPKILLSAGAAPIVIFSIVGKLFGIKTIFIESFSRVTKPSLTGKIMYRLADVFYYQWPSLEKYFPKGKFKGSIL